MLNDIDNCSVVDFSSFKYKLTPASSRKGHYEGVVTPISWDKNGRPKLFSLYRDNEEELVLHPLHSSISIDIFINKRVVVYGEKVNEQELFFDEVKLKDARVYENRAKPLHSDEDDEFPINLPQFYWS